MARLPDPAGAEAPVVILRLRGRTSLGSTFIKLVGDYADRLDDVGGRLYLSGLQPHLTEQLDRTGSIEGPVRAFEATAVVGESTQAAYLDAEAWLVRRHDKETPAELALVGYEGRLAFCGQRPTMAGNRRRSIALSSRW